MNRRSLTTLIATLLCLGVLASPALAQINISIDLGIAPPPPRYEVYEEVRPGYVLIPGYWFWDGHQHRWYEHRWEPARPGHHWTPARWEQRGDRHHFEPGRWEPDRHENMREEHGRGRSDEHRNDRREYSREGHDRR